jgi:hypothetical protein
MLSLAENPLTTVARVKADDKVAFLMTFFTLARFDLTTQGDQIG